MSASDMYVYENAMTKDFDRSLFQRKEWSYINDQNNGSYSGGQITFETTQTANSGKWINYQEGFLEIPIVTAFKSSVDITGAVSQFTVGLKNGFHQFIHSAQVDYNGTTVNQTTPFLNAYISYKLMTTFSQDDLIKWRGTLNFFPDTAASVRYSATGATAHGDGVSIASPQLIGFVDMSSLTAAAYISFGPNTGYQQRLLNTQYVASTASTIAALQTSPQTIGKANFTNDGGAAAARIYYTSIIAIIRLKDLSDFFDKLPLVKGSLVKIVLNVNTASFNVANVVNVSVAQPTSLVLSNGTNPLLVSSAAVNNPNYSTPSGTLSVACGISRATIGSTTVSNNILTSCRLYLPQYTMNAEYEKQYLDKHKVQLVRFTDVYQYLIPSVASGATSTTLLTQSVTAPKKVILIPLLSGASGNNTSGSVSELQSCYSGAPATTCPLAFLNQFQVSVSGINVFNQNVQYTFEQFLEHQAEDGALNGGKSTGLTSGLISQYDWENLYCYHTANIQRHQGGDECLVAKSVQVSFVNTTSKILDVYAFIEYERRVYIDVLLGSLVSNGSM